MEFLTKIFDAFWGILLFLEPDAWDEAFAFKGIFEFIKKLFQK